MPGSASALVRTRFAANGGPDARYTVRARVRLRARQEHRWVTTFDAAVAKAAIDDTMPDLTSVPGFRPRWALSPEEQIEIAAIVTEAPSALGDGTIERTTRATSFLLP